MTGLLRILLSGFVLLAAHTGAAQALECKSKAVTATSHLYVSKSFGAFPGSWAAWRKKVMAEVGADWQSWQRAREPKIECNRVPNDLGQERWQCTRMAIPCRQVGATADAALCDQYPVITLRLARGSSGPQVRMVQCLLNAHAIKIDIDGDYGPDTQNAVREFQRSNGLDVDGVVGDLTAEKLAG
jgi:DNA-directed RNA polymerase subunit N (RpoN/RPB10)